MSPEVTIGFEVHWKIPVDNGRHWTGGYPGMKDQKPLPTIQQARALVARRKETRPELYDFTIVQVTTIVSKTEVPL